ncbi:MAG: choice-of-anchor L domain-containing protein [Phormidesmis sp.]
MMHSIKKVSIIAATVTTALLHTFSASASAFTINQSTSNLLSELLGTTTGLSNFNVTTSGDSLAFGTFSNDPFGLGSGIVLSTGKVTDLSGENNGNASTDLAGVDSITLDISFDADDTVEKLFFSYVFGSEEFLEYAGSQFNDAFELLLNGVNLAFLTNGDAVTINNLVASPSGPFSPDYINNPAGPGTKTQLDGFTKVLGFEGILNKNATNLLSINIKDVGDSAFDSAVFIQGKSLSTVKPPTPTTDVPEPGIVLGLLAVGVTAGISRKQSQQTA